MKSLTKILFLLFLFAITITEISAQYKCHQKDKKLLKSAIETNTNWKTIKLNGFSFKVPFEMNLCSDKGIDSSFWNYENNQNSLDISIGQYVGFQSGLRSEQNYEEEKIKIGETEALICFYKLDEPIEEYKFVSRFFLLKENGAKLSISMTLYSIDQIDKEFSRKIFQSVRFK